MISTSGDAPGVRPEVPDSDAEKSNNLYPQHVGYQEEDAVQQRIASQDPKRITIIPNILASEPQPVYMSSPFDEIRLGKSSATFEDAAEALIRESLLPRDLSPQAKRFIPEDQHARLIRHTRNSQIPALGVPSNDLGADGKHTEERNASNQSVSNGPPRLERPPSTDPLSSIKVLICGHGNRGKLLRRLLSMEAKDA